MALDARIVVHGPGVRAEQLPKPAIWPRSESLCFAILHEGRHSSIIRPIRPEDEPLMVKFHATLSERSVYFRYFHLMNLSQRIAHERLTRIGFIDYDREMALVAERRNPATGEREILGVMPGEIPGTNDGEVAVLISDQFQGRGLGRELLARLLTVGADEKLAKLKADVLPTIAISCASSRRWASVCGIHWRTRSSRLNSSYDFQGVKTRGAHIEPPLRSFCRKSRSYFPWEPHSPTGTGSVEGIVNIVKIKLQR